MRGPAAAAAARARACPTYGPLKGPGQPTPSVVVRRFSRSTSTPESCTAAAPSSAKAGGAGSHAVAPRDAIVAIAERRPRGRPWVGGASPLWPRSSPEHGVASAFSKLAGYWDPLADVETIALWWRVCRALNVFGARDAGT